MPLPAGLGAGGCGPMTPAMRTSLSMLGVLLVLVVVAMLAAKLMVSQLPTAGAIGSRSGAVVSAPASFGGAVAAARASLTAQNAAAAAAQSAPAVSPAP